MSVSNIGPWASSGGAPRLVTIHDPVSGSFYTLDLNEKTARKLPALPGLASVAGMTAGVRTTAPDTVILEKQQLEKQQADKQVMEKQVLMTAGPMMTSSRIAMRYPSSSPARTESLGKRNIEGVMAEGTRDTIVIPAGEIGNDRPIEIVDERWYSPELQTVLLSRHSDPRMGETAYSLTNVRRVEPPPALFQVPADFRQVSADFRMAPDEPRLQIMKKTMEK
jgi:hypothetical protein